LRYNTDNGSPEAYTSTGWTALKSPVLPITAALDVPSIPTNGTVTITVTVTGAQLGNTVTVSPDGALINGVSIAWARVSAVNTVEIAFGNFSAAAIDPAFQNYFIKVVQ
jgi:trimeric autotransporter adhesin